uniref:Uncharacterized protein n=1 Tax=Trichogramma kaykai TaxID=54128 RepID=A0ABD2W3S3_9HYME
MSGLLLEGRIRTRAEEEDEYCPRVGRSFVLFCASDFPKCATISEPWRLGLVEPPVPWSGKSFDRGETSRQICRSQIDSGTTYTPISDKLTLAHACH